jgi:hypothetical protein
MTITSAMLPVRHGLGGATRLRKKRLTDEARRDRPLGRYAPDMGKFLPSLVAVLLIAFVGTYLIFYAFAWLGGHRVKIWWPEFGTIPTNGLFDLARSTVTVVGILGAAFAVVYAYRKQRIDEADGHRSDAKQLSQRYQDAATQLGHEKAAVRLAGVYAMALLADDWPEMRQTCVNVLCAYVRMPSQGSSDQESEVRTTVRRRRSPQGGLVPELV